MFTLAMGFGNPVEIAIIAGVVLLLFGGSRIAGFGKSVGRGIREFKEETQEKVPDSPTALSTRDASTSSTIPADTSKSDVGSSRL